MGSKMDFGTNQILITGANGWLGKTLIHCLINGMKNCKGLQKPQKKLEIKCLVLPSEDAKLISSLSDNVKIIYGDITKLEDCDYFTSKSENSILVHCAGIIHPPSVKHFFDINVGGTKNILDASVKNKVRKIIAISSNSPFGSNPTNEHRFDENNDYNPYLNYGKSKMLMEKLVKKSFNEGKINTVIIRPPWFYGPYQPSRQDRFYNMIRNGKVPVVGDGNNKRSMACTINISQAIIRAAIERKANGEAYWIADKNPYTFNQIISTIRKVMSHEFGLQCIDKIIKLPNFTSNLAYFSDVTMQKLGIYNKEIHVLSEMNKTIACSISKAESDINYNPQIDLYEGTYLSLSSSMVME
jgi:nucleoside-diphosphate-sugar epimerase